MWVFRSNVARIILFLDILSSKPVSQQEHFNHDGRAYNYIHDQRQQYALFPVSLCARESSRFGHYCIRAITHLFLI